MSHLNRKRYKLFLQPSANASQIPKTSLWRRRQQVVESGSSSTSIDENASSADPPESEVLRQESLQVADDNNSDSNSTVNSDISQSSRSSSSSSPGQIYEDCNNDLLDESCTSFLDDVLSSSDDADDEDDDMPAPAAPVPPINYSEKYRLDDEVPPQNSSLTKFEILLIILHFAMRFGLSNIAIRMLIQLVNTILGFQIIPPTDHIFQKIFSSSLTVKYHFFCPKCFLYIGVPKNTDTSVKCRVCDLDVDLRTSSGMNNFFITLPIEEQVRMKLEREGNVVVNYRKSRDVNHDYLCDVFDAVLFSELEVKNMSDSDVTINFNTDGAPVFESGPNSLWPIQFRLNEIDPKERFSGGNLMVAGLWFGRSKINMTLYLTPFIDELKKLANTGIRWFNRVTGEFLTTKVFLLQCILDSVAIPKVLNCKQFNGNYGCYHCYHEGTVSDGQVRYSAATKYPDRTDDSIRQDMQEAFQSDTIVRGMKGISPLFALPYFNIPDGTVIDYMHSHLLGVAKYMSQDLWMNTKFHDLDFYLTKEKIATIDKRLKKLKLASEISRDVHPLSDSTHWKANEWRSWLLFYAPLCLEGILPMRYYKNFCLLSCSLYILNKSRIPRSDFVFLGDYLSSFVSQFEVLYGLRHMTYNVHLTLHLKSCVIMNGPLWCFSAFPYESGNGYLVNLVQGTNGVAQQIARKFVTFCSIPEVISQHPALKDTVLDLCDRMMSFSRFKKFTTCDNVTVIGNRYRFKFIPSPEELNLLQQYNLVRDNFFEIKKIILRGSVYTPATSATERRDNSVVQLKDNKYARIVKMFFSPTELENLYAIVEVINIDSHHTFVPSINLNLHIKKCAFGDLSLININNNIKEKCLFFTCCNQFFVINFPNKFEKD